MSEFDAALDEIKTYRVPATVLMGPGLGAVLLGHASQVATIYQGIVAKRTGRLAATAHAYVTLGGHRNDRLIGKVTVGAGLEYSLLHEFGSKSNPHRQAAKDLAQAVELWKGANRV